MVILDPLLYDTYKKYKAGTTKVVTWLSETARATGLVDEFFQIEATPAKSNVHLTKKQKEKLKKRLERGSTFKLSVRTLKALADAVVKASTPVPAAIFDTLEAVIAARTECTKWFKSQQEKGDENMKESNATHIHFIVTLKVITALLSDLVVKSTKSATTKGKPVQEKLRVIDQTTNMFELLEVEDPEGEDSLPIFPATSPLPAKKSVQDVYEIEQTDGERSFAVYCLLKDLTGLRYFVRQSWAEYRERRITLTTASITMNTAIALMRQINEDFITSFPEFAEHGAILDFLYRDYLSPPEAHQQ